MKFSVRLVADAVVYSVVHIEAETKEAAEEAALNAAHNGDVEWIYDGVQDSTIELAW